MESTATLLPLWSISFILHCYGEVPIRKGADNSPSTTASATAAVLSNELLCQLNAEGFYRGEWTGRAVVLHQDIGIRYRHIKQKGENVLIKLSALRSTAIIPSELVSMIHTPHVAVVRDDALWTRHWISRPIRLFPEN